MRGVKNSGGVRFFLVVGAILILAFFASSITPIGLTGKFFQWNNIFNTKNIAQNSFESAQKGPDVIVEFLDPRNDGGSEFGGYSDVFYDAKILIYDSYFELLEFELMVDGKTVRTSPEVIPYFSAYIISTGYIIPPIGLDIGKHSMEARIVTSRWEKTIKTSFEIKGDAKNNNGIFKYSDLSNMKKKSSLDYSVDYNYKKDTISSTMVGSFCSTYRGRLYVPFFYYSGIYGTHPADDLDSLMNLNYQKGLAFKQKLEQGIDHINAELTQDQFHGFNKDFNEVIAIGFPLDYWEDELHVPHPLFTPIKDTGGNIVGIINLLTETSQQTLFEDIFVDGIPVYHPSTPTYTFMKKPNNKEMILLVDLIGVAANSSNSSIFIKCGYTMPTKGYMVFDSNSFTNPSSVCPESYTTGFTVAHELAHSMGLDHQDSQGLMCVLQNCDNNNKNLNVNQARILNGHMCGDPKEKMVFESTTLWQNPEFGVNKVVTSNEFACGNGMGGEFDECERSIVDVAPGQYSPANILTKCIKAEPEDGIVKWPNEDLYCTIGPVVPGSSAQPCICQPIPPDTTSPAAPGGNPIIPPAPPPPGMSPRPPRVGAGDSTGAGQLYGCNDPNIQLTGNQCCSDEDCGDNAVCGGIGGNNGAGPWECISCETLDNMPISGIGLCSSTEDCPVGCKTCTDAQGDEYQYCYDQPCEKCQCVNTDPPCP